MARSQSDRPVRTQVDYDLHGLVGIRLLNASPGDVAAVTRQLGPIQAPLAREPDIIIRFVDRLPLSSRVRYVGLNDAGFTDDAFLVLHTKHKVRANVQIPFEQIGKHCEIVCETGLPAVPLLIAIVNMTVLSKGAVPLHATAFTYKGTGVLLTGWAKGGKTETLLVFTSKGAEYVGDEWIYISCDGQRMYGIPEPIRVWDWHLQDLPQYWALVGQGDRIRLRALKLLVRLMDRATLKGGRSDLFPIKVMRRMLPLLKQQLYVQLPPQKLFGRGFGPLVGTPEKIFFVASHETPDMIVQPMDPQEIARRMVFSLQYERLDLIAYYMKFRFAFPEARNELIECAEELQRERLAQVLAGKDAYSVHHPYPVSIPALFDALSPLCQ